MLDQNTDRMWFVIGAVIVGAAIIFIANGSLPTLFASVSDSFEESSAKATEVVEDMSPNVDYISDAQAVAIPTKYAHLNQIAMSNIEQGSFNYINGTILPDDYVYHLDFERTDTAIPVEPGVKYYLSHSLDWSGGVVGVEMAWHFYDENMSPIEGLSHRSTGIGTVKRVTMTAPERARYIHVRFGHMHASWDNRNYFFAEYDAIR